jgi:hypothetical protein
VLDALREAHARGARIASVCVGAFALAATGLLVGRVAAARWRAVEFRRRFPAVRLNPGGQAQFASQVGDDDGLSATFGWMVGEMHRPSTVAQTIRRAGMPERKGSRGSSVRGRT